MSYDELELDTLGDRKTALFVIISDTDDTFNFVCAIMYAISPFSEMGYAAANTRKYTDMFRAGEIDPSVPGQAFCLEAYKESEMFYLSLINRLDQK